MIAVEMWRINAAKRARVRFLHARACGDFGNMVAAELAWHSAVACITETLVSGGTAPEMAEAFGRELRDDVDETHREWIEQTPRPPPPRYWPTWIARNIHITTYRR